MPFKVPPTSSHAPVSHALTEEDRRLIGECSRAALRDHAVYCSKRDNDAMSETTPQQREEHMHRYSAWVKETRRATGEDIRLRYEAARKTLADKPLSEYPSAPPYTESNKDGGREHVFGSTR